MSILQTARICVIDDEEAEYLPLIHALSRLGLGYVHFSGDKPEELPDQPLAGIRLVFLDMHLGTSGNDAAVSAQTANVFSRVVAADGGPFLVVFWTKHENLIDAFKARIFEKFPGYLGRSVFSRMEKPIDAVNAQKITTDITKELTKFAPLDVLWSWEQAAHDAASETTTELAKLSAARAGINAGHSETEMATRVTRSIGSILRTVLDASAGQNCCDETATSDLYAGLAPLLADRLEHTVSAQGAPDAAVLMGDQFEAGVSQAERAALNAMLLYAPPGSEASRLAPGCLYKISATGFKRIFRGNWNDFRDRLLNNLNEQQAATSGNALPILMEVSPACDYAQKKRPMARFVAGALLPAELREKVKNAESIRKLPVVKLEKPNGEWLLVFSSQYNYAVPSDKLPKGFTSLGRIRESALVDFRNWTSGQSARPGFLYI